MTPGRYTKDGKAHIAATVPFATILTPEPAPPAWGLHSDIVLTIPKIPYRLFRQIVAWQRKIAKEHECESTTSLFLIDDPDNEGKKKWVAVPFYQENDKKAMTIKVAYDPEAKPNGFMVDKNAELLAQYADHSDVHATLHNHVNWTAGQSGTDTEDEKGLPGPHITIGNLNQRKVDFHARLSTMVNGQHKFIMMRPSDIIGFPMPPGGISAETLKALEDAWLTFESSDEEIPEEWGDRFRIIEKKAIVPFHGQANPMVPASASAGRANPGEDQDLESYLLAQKDHLTHWPYGFLEGVDISSPEAFRVACSGMSLVQIYAMRGIMFKLGPGKDYNDVLAELQDRAQKKAATIGSS